MTLLWVDCWDVVKGLMQQPMLLQRRQLLMQRRQQLLRSLFYQLLPPH
jgi:hypothetical protein